MYTSSRVPGLIGDVIRADVNQNVEYKKRVPHTVGYDVPVLLSGLGMSLL